MRQSAWRIVTTAVAVGVCVWTVDAQARTTFVNERMAELGKMLEYFTRLWNERVNAPPQSDLVSMLAHGPSTRDMGPQEYMGNLVLLIVGGNDTTRNSMSGGVLALNRFPDQFEKLKANPDLIPNMVSEIIRWQTPLAYMRRIAKADTVRLVEGNTIVSNRT